MCFRGWMQSCPWLSVCFLHCCINISPAALVHFEEKPGFSLLEAASRTLWLLVAISIAFIFMCFGEPCIFYAEKHLVIHSVQMFPRPVSLPHFLLSRLPSSGVLGKCLSWQSSIISYFSFFKNLSALWAECEMRKRCLEAFLSCSRWLGSPRTVLSVTPCGLQGQWHPSVWWTLESMWPSPSSYWGSALELAFWGFQWGGDWSGIRTQVI